MALNVAICETSAGSWFSLDSQKNTEEQELVSTCDKHCNHLFGIGYVSLIDTDTYKEWLFYVQNAYKSGRYKLNELDKQTAESLCELPTLTECNQSNYDKFQRAYIKAKKGFMFNMAEYVKKESEAFIERCPNLRTKKPAIKIELTLFTDF